MTAISSAKPRRSPGILWRRDDKPVKMHFVTGGSFLRRGTMKAIVQEGYGSPDTLKLRDIEIPTPGDDGVLVEVHAASVNALDWHLARGVPFFLPLLEGMPGSRRCKACATGPGCVRRSACSSTGPAAASGPSPCRSRSG